MLKYTQCKNVVENIHIVGNKLVGGFIWNLENVCIYNAAFISAYAFLGESYGNAIRA